MSDSTRTPNVNHQKEENKCENKIILALLNVLLAYQAIYVLVQLMNWIYIAATNGLPTTNAQVAGHFSLTIIHFVSSLGVVVICVLSLIVKLHSTTNQTIVLVFSILFAIFGILGLLLNITDVAVGGPTFLFTSGSSYLGTAVPIGIGGYTSSGTGIGAGYGWSLDFLIPLALLTFLISRFIELR
jgi:hypothetical protein